MTSELENTLVSALSMVPKDYSLVVGLSNIKISTTNGTSRLVREAYLVLGKTNTPKLLKVLLDSGSDLNLY